MLTWLQEVEWVAQEQPVGVGSCVETALLDLLFTYDIV